MADHITSGLQQESKMDLAFLWKQITQQRMDLVLINCRALKPEKEFILIGANSNIGSYRFKFILWFFDQLS